MRWFGAWARRAREKGKREEEEPREAGAGGLVVEGQKVRGRGRGKGKGWAGVSGRRGRGGRGGRLAASCQGVCGLGILRTLGWNGVAMPARRLLGRRGGAVTSVSGGNLGVGRSGLGLG